MLGIRLFSLSGSTECANKRGTWDEAESHSAIRPAVVTTKKSCVTASDDLVPPGFTLMFSRPSNGRATAT